MFTSDLQETGLAVLNMAHTLGYYCSEYDPQSEQQSAEWCSMSPQPKEFSCNNEKSVIFLIHKKPFTEKLFQINARLIQW